MLPGVGAEKLYIIVVLKDYAEDIKTLNPFKRSYDCVMLLDNNDAHFHTLSFSLSLQPANQQAMPLIGIVKSRRESNEK